MEAIENPIKIIIADDHEITRYGLRVLLNTQQYFIIVAEACNGKELVAMARKYRPDIILTDIKMPEMDGLEATKIISKELPDIAIIGLSSFDDIYSVIDMLVAGAKGYLLKHADKEEALRAIATVQKNEFYYRGLAGAHLVDLFVRGQYPANTSHTVWLTEMERQVINLICREYSSKEIGAQLFLSTRTIEKYRDRIMEKTGNHSVAGLVLYAVRNKIYVGEAAS